jgi:2-polyprenyl-6-methoxyphenol hydroxylase-like FAD-dependent oxidoreductase
MGLGRIAAAAVLFLVLNATPAAAGAALSTGTLQVGDGTGVTYVCLVTNLDKKDLTYTLELVRLDGTSAFSTDILIIAGGTNGVTRGGVNDTALRCRLSGKFSSKKVVLTFSIRDNASDRTLVAVTAP